jgi:hypothetical protein
VHKGRVEAVLSKNVFISIMLTCLQLCRRGRRAS